MSNPKLSTLQHDLKQSQTALAQVEAQYGKSSAEYQQALKKFARLWSVLRLSRSQEEFLTEITA